jgi:hypothetical protein
MKVLITILIRKIQWEETLTFSVRSLNNFFWFHRAVMKYIKYAIKLLSVFSVLIYCGTNLWLYNGHVHQRYCFWLLMNCQHSHYRFFKFTLIISWHIALVLMNWAQTRVCCWPQKHKGKTHQRARTNRLTRTVCLISKYPCQ